MPLVALLFLSACGVAFSDDFDGTELFKGISLSGERVPGAELTVHLRINNGYPVPVRIGCYYEDPKTVTKEQEELAFNERATLIGETVLPAQEGRRPDKKYPGQELSFSFAAPEAGSYFLACFTPAAKDNGLGLNFKIGR